MSVISRVNWRVRAAAGLVLALVFVLSSVSLVSASGGIKLSKISHDPYTNTTSQHQTQVEPDTFSNGSTIVSAIQSGRFTDGGSSNIGWATSTDNGMTWKHGFLPGTTVFAKPAGTFARDTDPAVAYSAKDKTWLIVSLALDTNGTGVAILVSRSSDGLTWKKPTIALQAGNGDFFDKTWVVCDNTSASPYYGHCYIEFDNFALGDLEQMMTSTNSGKTWGAPMTTGNSASGIGGQPLVQPNGTVIVPLDDGFESSLMAFTSTNGGASWSSTVTVTSFSKSTVNGNLRAPDLISAEIDSTGKVYVVFYDCRFESNCSANDIVMTTSTDGVNWSAVTRIPTDAVGSGADHFLAGIAVDKSTGGGSAHLAVTYYFYPVGHCSSCQLEVGYVSSSNGGSSWSAKTTLTAKPITPSWLANTNQGYMVGDYISTSFSNGKAVPVFVNATAPKGSVFNEYMATIAGGLDASGGSISASHDRVLYTGAGNHPAKFQLKLSAI